MKKKEIEKKKDQILTMVQAEIKNIYYKAHSKHDAEQCECIVHVRMNEIWKELNDEIAMLYDDAIDQLKRRKRRAQEKEAREQQEMFEKMFEKKKEE